MSFIELRHPKTGGVWMCPADAVEGWLAKGWKRSDTAGNTVESAATAATGKDK